MTNAARRAAILKEYGGIIASASGVVLCVVAVWIDRTALMQSYLFTWWFFLGIALGSLVILMIHQLTGGTWGLVLCGPLAASALTLPAVTLMSLPLAFWYRDLYSWTAAASPNAHSWYLNTPFFWWRSVFYLAIWNLLLVRLMPRLLRNTIAPTPALVARLRKTSAFGLIAYGLTATLAAVDWIMSLTPEWYSTSFGLLSMLGQTLSAFAFAVVTAAGVLRQQELGARASADQCNDLGNLMLMLVMTWTYLAYTQYLIVWAENLPREISWYLPRTETSWRWIGLSLIVLHFAVPFFLLLFRVVKRNVVLLSSIAGMLLFAHWVDALWQVAPSLRSAGFQLYWTDLAALLSIGGTWLAVFTRIASRLPPELHAARVILSLHEGQADG